MMNILRLLNDSLWLPEVTIHMSGDESGKKSYDYFTKPHPKYKLIPNKRWGVALLPLPEHFDEYLGGKHKELLRRKRRRAMSLGFKLASIDPRAHLDEILAINTSMQLRQQVSSLPAGYLSIESISEAFKNARIFYGVIDSHGVLKAYAHTPIYGEAFVFATLLGHSDDLDKGIMYLLISEVIREMIERRRIGHLPLWAVYDTFFGARDGLRYFKERLGFKPYKVDWVWMGTS
jgi:hypothetical protein